MGKSRISYEKEKEIEDLRQKGYSVPEISRILVISKSTVLRYCKGISILPEFKGRWLARRNASKIISEKTWKTAEGTAAGLVGSVSDKELKMIGAALYWAEGAKRQFNFINSNPEMVKLFIHILLNVYNIPVNSIKVSIRIFEDIPIAGAIKFWSGITNLKLDDTTEINIIKGSKKGKLPYGMCRIRVKKGGLLLKTFFAINKRVISFISPHSSTDRTADS